MRRVLAVAAAGSIVLTSITACSFVSLQQYYASAGPTTQIAIDPIGGFMLLYWIDGNGTACHGSPGLSGQPGPAAVEVVEQAALQAAVAYSVVTPAQLADYQMIPYTLTGYLETNAAGYHLFQFDNVLWRAREDGRAFRDLGGHHYSVPQVFDIAKRPKVISPVYASGNSECDFAQFLALPAGIGLVDQPRQHPTKCRSKAFPSSATVEAGLLLSYCVKRLAEGTNYHIY